MEIEFTLKPEDLTAFVRHHRKLKNVDPHLSLRDIIVVSVSVVGIFLGLVEWLPAFLFGDIAFLPSTMGCLVGVFVGMLLLTWRQVLINRSSLKATWEDPRNEWAVRDVRVALSSNQVRILGRGAISIYEWPRVWHIGETDKHVFLYYTSDLATIIPRRAFRDDQHFEEFIALARQYQQERGQRAPKSTGIITALPPQSDAFTLPDTP